MPNLIRDVARCDTCEYWLSREDECAGYGDCHRHGPIYNGGFPTVKSDNWCGEHIGLPGTTLGPPLPPDEWKFTRDVKKGCGWIGTGPEDDMNK